MMPGEETKNSGTLTRLSLTETDEGTISVKWRVGDKINLCFVSNEGNVVRTSSNIEVTNISDNGKQAVFEISIPDDITGTFNLFGVYGATFVSVNSSSVRFPSYSMDGLGTALNDIENNCVMRFAAENLTEVSSPQVAFSHLGSILAVIIDNMSWNSLSFSNFGLSSYDKGYNWLNNSSNRATFDIATNSFIDAHAGTELGFYPSEGVFTIPAGGTKRFYNWIVPGDTIGTGSSATKFDFKTFMGSRNFSVPISTIKLVPGKYYRLRMDWSGSDLIYNFPFVTDIDGNSYKTINIGTQKWMAENLKVTKYNDGANIPNVMFSIDWQELTTGALADYAYSPSNSEIYGKLYNWYAVNTAKLCPTGWHVPSDSEWITLQNFLIANGYNYNGANSGNYIAKALATASGWDLSTIAGAVGTDDYPEKQNASGFSALPAGLRHYQGGSYSMGTGAYWWTSTMVNANTAKNRYIEHYSSSLRNRDESMNNGYSVRCVRD